MINNVIKRNLSSGAKDLMPKGIAAMKVNPPSIAIVGSSGAVGQELLKIIEEQQIPFKDLTLLASHRSAGKKETFMGKEYTVKELTKDSFEGIDVALFSAGGSQSIEFAPAATNAGALVVDNSSAFRMDPECPLVVPEINPEDMVNGSLKKNIIANPNCSTIIMNMAVWPIYQAVGVDRIVVSTYQAASGAGLTAMQELEQQARDWYESKPYTQDIFGRQYMWNLFSHNSDIEQDNGYNEEEIKMVKETKKIFHDNDIQVTATCVRVPILRAHSESINLTLKKPLTADEARDILKGYPGIKIIDDREANRHPEPLDASGNDDVWVGRLRNDISQKDNLGLEMFVSSDQIRKGAATNALSCLIAFFALTEGNPFPLK